MTKEFDKRNAAKSRKVCEDMEAAHVTKWLKLTERERRILAIWPRYEDTGDCVMPGDRVALEDGSAEVLCQLHIGGSYYSLYTETHDEEHPCGERVERPAPKVLDADGVEIKAGDTVYGIGRTQHRFEVIDPHHIDPEVGEAFSVRCYARDEHEECHCKPKLLTHTRPDSWERLEEDAEFNDETGIVGGNLDIVRRAKALAGVEVAE